MTAKENTPAAGTARGGNRGLDDRRRFDSTTCGCACHEIQVLQLENMSLTIDRLEGAVASMEQGFAAMLSRLSQALLEFQIHQTIEDFEEGRRRRL